MEDRSYYTQEECDEVIRRIKKGYEYFHRLQRAAWNDKGRYFIFLFSDDDEINQWTLYYLPILRREMEVSEFNIITPYTDKIGRGQYECRAPYTVEKCTVEEMSALCRYFYCILDVPYKRNFLRIVINGWGDIGSERLYEYIGVNDITKKEAVALTIMLFCRVPDNKEVEEATEYKPQLRKYAIDWSVYHCEETEDILEFPVNVDKGLDRLMADEVIGRDDKIVVFSVTMTSRHIIDRLKGRNVVAVLDNKRELAGSECEGIRVYTPEEYLTGEHPDDFKIIVPTRSYQPICEQLNDLGYHVGEQVFITYIEYIPYNATILQYDMLKGREIYEEIRHKYPKERLYFIAFNGIGDTYLAGMYLGDRMKYDGEDHGVVVFVSETCRRVFELLKHSALVTGEYVLRDNREFLQLLLFVRQMGYEKLGVCNLTHSYDLIDPGYLRGHKGLDFNSMVQAVGYHAPVKKTRVEVISKDSSDIIKSYRLKEGETAILSPYAKSAKALPEGFWEELAERLIDKGYTVCTNIAGSEQAIEGTIPLSAPLEHIFDLVEKCGVFIGLRSGLCDLISHSQSKKIILYSLVQTWGGDYTYSFFGLKNMGFADENTWEYIVEADYHMTINEIITCLT